jgi:hypothetical protein
LYPDISDRTAYKAIPQDFRQKIIREAQEYRQKPWSQILLSDYLEFSRNGNRSRFEELYFSRRRKLCSLIMAECVEAEGRFLEDILDGLYLILEESAWCLPAHNTHVRDEKQQEFPDTEHPIIDLFDAETGALVAFAEYLLRPLLIKRSPGISELINRRLDERIFTPYRTEHFWWMGDGEQPMCNWTPWCVQNVLICALTRPEGYFTTEELRGFLESAAVSLDFFLDEYGDDGCCNEGAQYYSHAGLCLFGALYIMDNVLAGSGFNEVFSRDLIKNIAAYIVRMNVTDNTYINFADCAAVCPRRTSREYLFGKYCKDPVLAAFAAEDFRRGTDADKLLRDEINLFYHVIQAFSYKEMEECPKAEALCEDSYFESTGLMVARDDTYLLAAKAGNNADSHNHNDVGSFTVYKNGKPLIIDLGVGTYTRETFSDRRYEIWTMQSQFHNLPTFVTADHPEAPGKEPARDLYDTGIVMQRDGADYRATDVNCSLDKIVNKNEISSLSMDIATAYNDDRVKAYRREISLIKGKEILVEDNYEGDLKCRVSLMTYEKPEIMKGTEPGSFSLKIGDLATALLTGAESVSAEAYPIEDERLKISWKHEVYRVLIEMGKEKALALKIQ